MVIYMEIKFSNSLKGDSKPTDYANAIMNGVAVKPYFGGGYVPTSERVKVVDSPRLEYTQVDPQSYSDVINQVLADSKKPGYMNKLPSIEDYGYDWNDENLAGLDPDMVAKLKANERSQFNTTGVTSDTLDYFLSKGWIKPIAKTQPEQVQAPQEQAYQEPQSGYEVPGYQEPQGGYVVPVKKQWDMNDINIPSRNVGGYTPSPTEADAKNTVKPQATTTTLYREPGVEYNEYGDILSPRNPGLTVLAKDFFSRLFSK